MLFFKRIILGSLALGFIFLGGSGTQSNSLLAQGGGFVGLLLGLVVLYVFFKMAWRAMGCLPSFIMFSIVIIFILYAIGAFTNGTGNVASSLKSFIGQGAVPITEPNNEEQEEGFDLVDQSGVMEENNEDFSDFDDVDLFAEENDRAKQQNQGQSKTSTFSDLLNAIANPQQQQQQEQRPVGFNPEAMPSIYGLPRVINGDTIVINGGRLKFYAIDAPEANQTCSDRHRRSYQCGREAALWLRSWITGNNIECKIVKKDSKNNMYGICNLGEYDIGAALVNAGWAVADTRVSGVYVPYQQQARANRRGLWQGEFYMPWDWKTLQAKKPKIKIIKPKKAKKSILEL